MNIAQLIEDAAHMQAECNSALQKIDMLEAQLSMIVAGFCSGYFFLTVFPATRVYHTFLNVNSFVRSISIAVLTDAAYIFSEFL